MSSFYKIAFLLILIKQFENTPKSVKSGIIKIKFLVPHQLSLCPAQCHRYMFVNSTVELIKEYKDFTSNKRKKKETN